MDINIYKNYHIKSDKRQYILSQQVVVQVEDKEDTIRDEYVTYHSTMENAINELCSKELRASKATSLVELKKDLNILQEFCTELCNQIGDDSPMSQCLQADIIKEERIKAKRELRKL